MNNTDIYYDGQRFYQRWVVPGVFRAEVFDILTDNVIPIATVNTATMGEVTKIGNVVTIAVTLVNAFPSNTYWWSTEVDGNRYFIRPGTSLRSYNRSYSWIPSGFPSQATPNLIGINATPTNTAGLVYRSTDIPLSAGNFDFYNSVLAQCGLNATMDGSDLVFNSPYRYRLGVEYPDAWYDDPNIDIYKRININYHIGI